MRLYSDLVDWYRIVTPPEHYRDEAAWYLARLLEHGDGRVDSLLELGCGAGHNARWLREEVGELVLSDLSPDMLELSRALNPDCVHVLGDMRTLRLDRTFDAVFVHDAVAYMATLDDLRACIRTVAAHVRPGGVVMLCPDDVRDGWEERTDIDSGTDGDRSVRWVEHHWDPDPSDDSAVCDFTFTLVEADGSTREVTDRHVCGLFWCQTWWQLLEEAGLEPAMRRDGPEGTTLFLGRRPV